MTRQELGESFRKNRVKAKSVADFLDRYYKPDRYRGRGAEYAATLLKSYQEDVEQDGWTIISHHDSATGQVVAYFPEYESDGSQPSLFDLEGAA